MKLYQRRDVNETLSSTLEVVLRQVRVPIPQSKDLTKGIQKERTCHSLLFCQGRSSGGTEVKDNREKTTLRSGVMYNVGEVCT